MGDRKIQGTTTLIGRMRAILERRDVSDNLQKAWLYWARSLLLFHEGRSPETLQLDDITAFLDHLDSRRQMTPASRRQAVMAVECLMADVIGVEVTGLNELVAEYRRLHQPVVLTPYQVQQLLSHLSGAHWLMGSLVYGAGLRLKECARLRVRDIEDDRIVVRGTSGRFDRESVLPQRVRAPLLKHLEKLKMQHIRELADGRGAVVLPPHIKPSLATARSWAWQFLFPWVYVADRSRLGAESRRTHVPDSEIASAIEKAASKAGIEQKITVNTLRNSFALHLIRRGVAVADVERLLGISRLWPEDDESDTPRSDGQTPAALSPVDLLAPH